jgi:hypothetical protein
VSENRVLKRLFGPKKEELVGDWRRLHHEELHNLYVSQNIIRVIDLRGEIGGTCSSMGEIINAYKILVCKSERKRPLGRPRRRWEDNMRMTLREIVWGVVEWM